MPRRDEKDPDVSVELPGENSSDDVIRVRDKETGRYVPKPGGPKATEDLEKFQHISRVTKPHTYTAVRKALDLMQNSKSDKVKLDAVKIILAYAWGNPPTMQVNINQNLDELSGITSSEIKMLLSHAKSSEDSIDVEWEEEEDDGEDK